MSLTQPSAAAAGEPSGASKTRVLILAYYFPPDATSGAKRPSRFATYLSQFDHPVHVVTDGYAGPYEQWPVICISPRHELTVPVQRQTRIVSAVQRHCLPYNDQLPWIPFALNRSVEAFRRDRIDAVLSTSPPIATHLAAAELKRRYRIKWIADFRDPLSGNPFRTRRLGRLYDRVLESYIVRNADALLLNTDTAAEAMKERYPKYAHKMSLLWNGYDPAEGFGPAPLPPRRRRVVAHVGMLYGGRHPAVFLSSLDRLITSGRIDPATIQVKLVGAMNLDDPWVSQCPFHRLHERGCLEYSGVRVPEQQARCVIAESEYLLLLDLNDLNTTLQVPAKIFDYLQAGRPILAFTSAKSPAETILANSGVPHRCIYPGEAETAVDAKLAEYFALSLEPVAASVWFWKNFSAPEQARTLSRLLDRLAH